MKFNVENSDVIMMNGSLRLVYHTDKMDMPMTMVVSNSYHDLNEKAMSVFGEREWAENVIEWSLHGESPIWHNLLADIYKNHYDLYESLVYAEDEDDDSEDLYLSLTSTGEVDDKTGHRLARFNKADLNEMDTDDLINLAETLEVYEPYMLRDEIIEILANEDIDIDDCGHDECSNNCEGCECAEKTPAGNVICHYDEDEEEDDECDCDGERDCCGCAGCEGDTCDEADEHPEWPHSIEEEQSNTQQYEYVNGPAHYHGTECIENMRKLYGDEAVRWFCILSAYKYRFRDGSKPGVNAKQDHEKANWYENYAVNMMGNQRYYS